MLVPTHVFASPLLAIIEEAVALEDALTRQRFPRACHHTRIIVLRAQGAGLHSITGCGLVLLEALTAAALPPAHAVVLALGALSLAIEGAMDRETL
ncbi:MAG: hypothetical protein AAGC76_05445 [Luteibacter sp.]|uniref:hypothetical protein n=1 Tax=Luteibacter sp. TaxID=1886636 RepID=UPI002809D0C5|nr:hypothetical protein [Luteibacter sp.]MDQ7995282.1 hypothetical protein [Luteibacter sp.]